MSRHIPLCCETCQFEKGCDLRKYVIMADEIDKCQNYVMSDACILCSSCSKENCFNFGSCIPFQEVLF